MSIDIEKEAADFEAWWEASGQYSRAGGGEYEKTFAYNAWMHRTAQPAPIPAQTEQHQGKCDSALRAEAAATMTRLSMVMLALNDARAVAMRNTVEARIPECGDFGRIAQNLDWAIGEMERAAIVIAEQSEATRCCAEGGNTCNEGSLLLAGNALTEEAKDAARLDFMAEHEAWIGWSKDGESCRVFHSDEDGDVLPMLGWGARHWRHSAREAIDAAIASHIKAGQGQGDTK